MAGFDGGGGGLGGGGGGGGNGSGESGADANVDQSGGREADRGRSTVIGDGGDDDDEDDRDTKRALEEGGGEAGRRRRRRKNGDRSSPSFFSGRHYSRWNVVGCPGARCTDPKVGWGFSLEGINTWLVG